MTYKQWIQTRGIDKLARYLVYASEYTDYDGTHYRLFTTNEDTTDFDKAVMDAKEYLKKEIDNE